MEPLKVVLQYSHKEGVGSSRFNFPMMLRIRWVHSCIGFMKRRCEELVIEEADRQEMLELRDN